jgi:hypothetical protein
MSWIEKHELIAAVSIIRETVMNILLHAPVNPISGFTKVNNMGASRQRRVGPRAKTRLIEAKRKYL